VAAVIGGAPVAVSLIGAQRMEEGFTPTTLMDGCRKGVASGFFGCPYSVKAISEPVGRVVKVDVNGWERVALLQRFSILVDDRLRESNAGLGALGSNTIKGKQLGC
jgi:hypothetical protein